VTFVQQMKKTTTTTATAIPGPPPAPPNTSNTAAAPPPPPPGSESGGSKPPPTVGGSPSVANGSPGVAKQHHELESERERVASAAKREFLRLLNLTHVLFLSQAGEKEHTIATAKALQGGFWKAPWRGSWMQNVPFFFLHVRMCVIRSCVIRSCVPCKNNV
jgi:hypothetical protein